MSLDGENIIFGGQANEIVAKLSQTAERLVVEEDSSKGEIDSYYCDESPHKSVITH